MATAAPSPLPAASVHDKLAKSSPGMIGMIIFGLALVAGVVYTGVSIATDMGSVHTASLTAYILLGIALLTALAFGSSTAFMTPRMLLPP